MQYKELAEADQQKGGFPYLEGRSALRGADKRGGADVSHRH